MLQIAQLPSTRSGFHPALLDLRALTLGHWTRLPLLDPRGYRPRPTLQQMHSPAAAPHQGAPFPWRMTGKAPSGFTQHGGKAHARGGMVTWHRAVSSVLGGSIILPSPGKLWKKSSFHCLIMPFQWLLSMATTVTPRYNWPRYNSAFLSKSRRLTSQAPRPVALPISTHWQQIAFNSTGPLVNLHSAKLTFPNVSHGTGRVRKIYCQEPKICYLVKYGFFHGLIWTSYQKLWSGSMIIHHLRKGKGSSEAFRAHISQPYQTLTQVIKRSASSNCRACWSHSRERDTFLWMRRSLRTSTSTEKVGTNFPGECRGKKSSPTSPSPSHPWKSTKAPLIRAFLSSMRAWMVFGLTHYEAALLWGDAEARIISTKTRASLRALGGKSTRNWGKQKGRVQDLGVSCDQPRAGTCTGRSHCWRLKRTVVWTGESGKSRSLQRRHAAKEEAGRMRILLSLSSLLHSLGLSSIGPMKPQPFQLRTPLVWTLKLTANS